MAEAMAPHADSASNGMPASIPELLRLRRSEPDGEFLVTDTERLTFAEADTASLELADALLASGVICSINPAACQRGCFSPATYSGAAASRITVGSCSDCSK